MAKQGMKRPEKTHSQARNEAAPVPEIQGKAKCGKKQVHAIIARRFIIQSLIQKSRIRKSRYPMRMLLLIMIWQGIILKMI